MLLYICFVVHVQPVVGLWRVYMAAVRASARHVCTPTGMVADVVR